MHVLRDILYIVHGIPNVNSNGNLIGQHIMVQQLLSLFPEKELYVLRVFNQLLKFTQQHSLSESAYLV
jgi:hypothetical protein